SGPDSSSFSRLDTEVEIVSTAVCTPRILSVDRRRRPLSHKEDIARARPAGPDRFDTRRESLARGQIVWHGGAMGRIPQVLALGGGGFSMESGNPLVDDFALPNPGFERP